ncbi:MAG: rod shape-determining protein, partial [Candidatus Bathyarchaeia archaeon]
PSIYAYRQPNIWEDGFETIEGVGEQALEIAKYPNAIKLYPILDGKPQHQAFLKLAREAICRLELDSSNTLYLVSGLLYETAKPERERIKQILRESLSLREIAVYPQCLGTLFDLDLQSATVINIGHGTTEVLIVENLNTLAGFSQPLACDFLLTNLVEYVQAKHGLKLIMENIVSLIVGNIRSISAFGKSVSINDIKDRLESGIDQLAEKICYDARYLLTQLQANLECSSKIVLSGGGSMIKGMKQAVEEKLGMKVLVPSNPIFSNVQGFYKIRLKLYGQDKSC